MGVLLYSCPKLYKCYDRPASTNKEIVRKSDLRSLNLNITNVSLYTLYPGVPNLWDQCLMIWRADVIIMIEIKCVINVMLLNYPQTTIPPLSVEKLFSTKPVPGAKKVGDCCRSILILLKLWSTNWQHHRYLEDCYKHKSSGHPDIQSLGCSQGTWPSPRGSRWLCASKLWESLGNTAASLILIWI